MNFGQIVADLVAVAEVEDAQRAIRVAHGSGASRWVAAEANIVERTGRRWLSSNPPASRIPVIVALADELIVAAQVMRRSSGTLDVGRVSVSYDGHDQGTRDVGEVEIDLEPIADALEDRDEGYAEELFSNAVMDAYQSGLSDALTVENYGDVRIDQVRPASAPDEQDQDDADEEPVVRTTKAVSQPTLFDEAERPTKTPAKTSSDANATEDQTPEEQTQTLTFPSSESAEEWMRNLERSNIITSYQETATGRRGVRLTVTYRPRPTTQ